MSSKIISVDESIYTSRVKSNQRTLMQLFKKMETYYNKEPYSNIYGSFNKIYTGVATFEYELRPIRFTIEESDTAYMGYIGLNLESAKFHVRNIGDYTGENAYWKSYAVGYARAVHGYKDSGYTVDDYDDSLATDEIKTAYNNYIGRLEKAANSFSGKVLQMDPEQFPKLKNGSIAPICTINFANSDMLIHWIKYTMHKATVLSDYLNFASDMRYELGTEHLDRNVQRAVRDFKDSAFLFHIHSTEEFKNHIHNVDVGYKAKKLY